ncbi:hypothetical protein [Micromonospora sp. KC207]|nr:hypothetical protein [Micromonospora sp. KC207]
MPPLGLAPPAAAWVRGLKGWAEAHMDDVLANRATYDDHVA